MMTKAPEFEEIRIVKKDQQKRTIGKRLDFFSGHFSMAGKPEDTVLLKKLAHMWLVDELGS